jgi:hypothetical protein
VPLALWLKATCWISARWPCGTTAGFSVTDAKPSGLGTPAKRIKRFINKTN